MYFSFLSSFVFFLCCDIAKFILIKNFDRNGYLLLQLTSHRRTRKKSETTPGEVPLKDKTDFAINSYDNPTMNGNEPHDQIGLYLIDGVTYAF